MSEESTITVTPVETKAPVEGISGPEATEVKEAVPEVKEPVVEKPKDEFASKFAALSRAERRAKQKEADIAKKIADFERQQKELADKYKPFEEKYKSMEQKQAELAQRLKTKPLKTLKEEFGLSFDDLTKYALADDNPTPDMLVKSVKEELESKYSKQIDQLREEYLNSEKKKAEEDFKRTEQTYLNNLTAEINANEKYELIKANDAVDMVYELQNEVYNTKGKILSNTEAADLIEQHLEEKLDKLLQLEKVKRKSGAQKPAPEPTPKNGKPSVTLSNANSQVAPKSERKLSDAESKAMAAKLLKWTE